MSVWLVRAYLARDPQSGTRSITTRPFIVVSRITAVLSTTVVDRVQAAVNRAFDSGSTWLGIDVVFATGTNAADVQVRALRATAFR